MKFDPAPLRRFALEASRCWSVAFVGLALLPPAIGEPLAPGPMPTEAVDVQFRGCQPPGWCHFWIETPDPLAQPLLRVRPEGVSPVPAGNLGAVAVRDRLNALLAGMIHQHKRIVLHGSRRLEDGTYLAVVRVNGMDVASDPVLLELLESRTGASR
jgi:hypothetical protein